jgi:hypothetical protein
VVVIVAVVPFPSKVVDVAGEAAICAPVHRSTVIDDQPTPAPPLLTVMDAVILVPPDVTTPVHITDKQLFVTVDSTRLFQVIPPPVAVGVLILRLYVSADAFNTMSSFVAGVKEGVVCVRGSVLSGEFTLYEAANAMAIRHRLH